MAGDFVVPCHNVDTWSQHFNEAKSSKKLVVVYFTVAWCGPCRMIAPFFADLSKKFTNVFFLKVDVDEHTSLSEECNVNAMPTFMFFKEGKECHRIVGALKEKLERMIETHSAASTI